MITFDNSYARLPQRFYAAVMPARVRAPRVVAVRKPVAEVLGLDAAWLASPDGADMLSGNVVPDGAASIALAYAGHQFGNFVPQLGDGRAILLGEIVGRDGMRRDVQLKGSGRTPFSRNGDGRAALGPALREYLVSEAMAALGIPTTRALAVVTTGEPVMRERPLPGAVMVRVAASHLRVGTFEYFAARTDRDALTTLVDYALARHYSHAQDSDNHARALLEQVIRAHAELVARWLGIGFVHGVMNTDNTSISGETLDFGPCAFLDEYAPNKKFSSIDRGGRYAFSNQPRIAHWNLACLGEALLPLLHDDEREAVRIATQELDRFGTIFNRAYARVMRAKLGMTLDRGDELEIVADLFERMHASEVDFTLFFRTLCACASDPAHDAEAAALFAKPEAFHEWAARWRQRLAVENVAPEERAAAMRRANPAVIPRNHRIEEIIAAAENDDFAPFEKLARALEHPYEDHPEHAWLTTPPAREERVQATFCGT
jgi:serine/tyrosine/threonine adenylyltransferase